MVGMSQEVVPLGDPCLEIQGWFQLEMVADAQHTTGSLLAVV